MVNFFAFIHCLIHQISESGEKEISNQALPLTTSSRALCPWQPGKPSTSFSMGGRLKGHAGKTGRAMFIQWCHPAPLCFGQTVQMAVIKKKDVLREQPQRINLMKIILSSLYADLFVCACHVLAHIHSHRQCYMARCATSGWLTGSDYRSLAPFPSREEAASFF